MVCSKMYHNRFQCCKQELLALLCPFPDDQDCLLTRRRWLLLHRRTRHTLVVYGDARSILTYCNEILSWSAKCHARLWVAWSLTMCHIHTLQWWGFDPPLQNINSMLPTSCRWSRIHGIDPKLTWRTGICSWATRSTKAPAFQLFKCRSERSQTDSNSVLPTNGWS